MSSDPLVRYLASPSSRHFASLVEETAPQVLGAAYRVLGDRALAEDVAQDVFVKVLTGGSLPRDGKLGSASLFLKARSGAMTMRRCLSRRQSRERIAHREREARADGAAFSSDDIHDVRAAVEQLPPDLRGAVELCYFAGLGVSEAARVSGTSRHDVSALLQRAIKSLRTRLSASAAALILPVLEGSGEAALPAIVVSEELAARLRGLRSAARGARPGSRSRRLPSRLSAPVMTAAVAACAVISLLGFLGWKRLEGAGGAGRGRGPVAGGRLEIRLGPDGVTGRGPDGRLVAAAPAVPGAPAEGEGAAGSAAPRARREERKDAAGSPRIDEENVTSVFLRVIDEGGELLDDGILDFELGERSRSGRLSREEQARREVQDEILRARHLGQRSLSSENPVVLRGLPPAVLGRELEASVRWGTFSPEWSVVFRAERGVTVEVDLVVPRRPRRKIVVVDASTLEPIAGAFAWPTDRAFLRAGGGHVLDERGTADPMVSTPPIETDALGRCAVAGGSGMPLALKVWADGYRNATAREEDLGAEGVVRLEPRGGGPTGSLAVRVLRDGRWPVRGAWVELTGRSVHLFKDSDGAGRLVFERLDPGEYVVKLADFSDPEQLGTSGTIEDEASSFLTTVRVRAGEEAALTLGGGRARSAVIVDVADPTGRPREGVKVKLACVLEGFHGTTDAGGRAILEDVPPEGCLLTAGDEGAAWDVGKVVPEAGERVVKGIVLGNGVIRGRVRGPAGKDPPALVRVRVGGPLAGSADVAADGTFEIAGALPGVYRVKAVEPGHVSEEAEVIVPHAGTRPMVEVDLELRVKAGEEGPAGDSGPPPGRS